MRKFIFLLFTLLFCTAIFAQRNQISWHEQGDAHRGFVEDYSGFQEFTDRNTGMVYYLANDSNDLFIVYLATNETIKRKLIRVGFAVDIEIPDRKDKIARITFPPDPLASEPISRGSQVIDLFSRKAAYTSRTTKFFTEGFEKTNGQLALGRWVGLSSRIRHDSLSLFYEIKIPLKELFGHDYSFREIIRQDIILTALVEAIPRPRDERSREPIPPADDRFGSPTRRPGGAMHPERLTRVPTGTPRYMPVDGSSELLFRKQRIKRKFRLASGNNQIVGRNF